MIAFNNNKISTYAKLVDEIQTYSRPVIERVYREFLLQSHDSEEREYPDTKDQIREVLIHVNYLSQKDIDICRVFNLISLADQSAFDSIAALHEIVKSEYSPDEEGGG